MRRHVALFAISGLLLMAARADACLTFAPLKVEDVSFADVVVVGRISNYQIVLDQDVRRKRKEFLAKSTDLPADSRKWMSEQKVFLTDYARFDILVDEILVGKPPAKLTVTWDASTFREPAAMAAGPFLIALRSARSRIPPLRGPSATIFPLPEPGLLTVLHPPCASAFIFPIESDVAAETRKALVARSK